MHVDELEKLEHDLLALGRTELALEQALQDLLGLSREAGKAGRAKEADQAWTLYDQTRKQLDDVKARIRIVESQLYSRRLRRPR